MARIRRISLGMIISVLFLQSFGQEFRTKKKDSGFNKPTVVGLPRVKALQAKYEFVPQFRIRSTAKQPPFENTKNVVRQNHRYDFRIRFPVIYKPSLTLGIGFKYLYEEFHFLHLDGDEKFYQALEDKSLKSLGASLFVIKSTIGERYYLLNTNFDFNGDYNKKSYALSDFLKFSITPLIGWKKNDNLSYAVGISYSYSFGFPTIYPVLSYNKNFNKHWGIETLLPVHARLRYTHNDRNYFYAGFALNGASYRLDNRVDSVFFSYNNLHLHRSEIKMNISLEKEIYDWAWFSLETGFRHNLAFNLTNSARTRRQIILKNKLSDGFVVGLSIFIVPPRIMFKNRSRLQQD